MIGVLAELERSLITERTRAGVKFGRTLKLSPSQITHAREQIEKGRSVDEVAALLRVGRSTLYRAFERHAA